MKKTCAFKAIIADPDGTNPRLAIMIAPSPGYDLAEAERSLRERFGDDRVLSVEKIRQITNVMEFEA